MEKKIREQGRNIGYGIPIPAKPSEYDVNDPFYGTVRIKKNNFEGYVVSAKVAKSAIVAIDRQVFVKKYSRYLKKTTKIQVHNPLSIQAKEGDVVRFFETRPLSKTKHFVIVEVIGKRVEIQGQDLAKEAKDAITEKADTKSEDTE